VQDALLEVARFWLDRGVDGFRIDAVSHFTHDVQLRDNPPRSAGPRTRPVDYQQLLYNSDRRETLVFLERLRAVLDRYPDRFALGEIGGPDSAQRGFADYLAGGRLHSAYSFLFLRADELTPQLVRQTVAAWDRQQPQAWPTWVFSNHDAPRVVSRWGGEAPRAQYATLLNALLLALRGSVCLYQGEELGLPQAHVPFERLLDPEAIANWPQTFGRDGARTPIPWTGAAPHAGFSDAEPWLPVDPRHLAAAVDRQLGVAGSVLEATRGLLSLRHEHEALRRGDLVFLAAGEPLLAFERRAARDLLLCVFNLGAAAARFADPGGRRWQQRAGSAHSTTQGAAFELPPYGFAIARPARA
jgi:alpha-glucosidase